jgi:hypothetical protein
MNTNAAKSEMAVSDSSFIAFVFSIAGIALLESWLLILHAGFRTQAIALTVGLLPTSVALWAYWRDKRNFQLDAVNFSSRSERLRSFNLLSSSLLVATGVALGAIMMYAGVFALSVALAGLTFAPWSRISFYRKYFIGACISFWFGAGSVLLLSHQLIDFMILPFFSWTFWAFASVALFRRTEHLWRAERSAKSCSKLVQISAIPEPIYASRASSTSAVKSKDEPIA